MNINEADPKGVIRESYRIEGITASECRSILLDWAMSLPVEVDPAAALRLLLATVGAPNHPMTAVLTDGLAPPPKACRRGGRAGRRGV